MSKVTKSIRIKKEQADWLKKNPSINLSGLVQERLDQVMKRKEEEPEIDLPEKLEKIIREIEAYTEIKANRIIEIYNREGDIKKTLKKLIKEADSTREKCFVDNLIS